MAPTVIDLTSSPEPEVSPEKAARSALQKFQPRAQKASLPKPGPRGNEQSQQPPTKAARSAAEQSQWRSDNAYGKWNGETSRFVPSLLAVANSLSRDREGQDRLMKYERPTYERPQSAIYPPREHGSAARQSLPLNGVSTKPIPSNDPRAPIRKTPLPGSNRLQHRPTPEQRLPNTSSKKNSIEIITIDDDSSSSSSGASESEPRAFFRENNLDDIRPFKRRRVDEPALNPSRDFVVNQQRPQSVKGASATAPRPSIERNGVVPLRNALPATTKPVSLTGIGQRTTSQTPGDSVLPRRMATAIESRSVTSGSETIGTYRRKKPDAIPPHASRNKSENIAVAHAGPSVIKQVTNTSITLRSRSQSKGPESGSSGALTYESARSGRRSQSRPNPGSLETSQGKQVDATVHASIDSGAVAEAPDSSATRQRKSYSQAENDLLVKLRGEQKLDWKEILPHLPGRTMGSISGHYSEMLAGKHKKYTTLPTASHQEAIRATLHAHGKEKLPTTLGEPENLDINHVAPHYPGPTIGSTSGHYGQLEAQTPDAQHEAMAPSQGAISMVARGVPYSQLEDELLIKLKEVDKMDWNSILPHFPGRTMGSISGHYGQLKTKVQQEPQKLKPFLQSNPSGSHSVHYSAEEDALIVRLKEVDNLRWQEIAPYFPGRTWTSLQVRYSSKLKSKSKAHTPRPARSIEPTQSTERAGTTSNHGVPYSSDEDALVLKLREEGLSWDQMVAHFNGRTPGSLAVRYSSKLKDRQDRHTAADDSALHLTSTDDDSAPRPQRRRRHNGLSVLSGFISWADIKKSRRNVFEDEESAAEGEQDVQKPVKQRSWASERQHPKSLQRILRQRELGSNSGRGWLPSTHSVPDELKEHVFDDVGPQKYFQGTSGDVTCIAWGADGNRFAAGSIAITDERSMQYNKPCNLLLGDVSESTLYELPEHHIQRPMNSDLGNMNSLRSMRESQDQRLFMTVGSVQFSPDSKTLYSAGTDCKVRAYSAGHGGVPVSCRYEIEHPAPVYLLSVSNQDVLATACHQATDDSVRVYNGQMTSALLSPSRADSQTERAIYPSSLKWGTSSHHSNLLLAGFSIDSIDEERNLAGETCLWDLRHEAQIEVNAVTRNVFDLAWNPSPSSGSTAFAVASTPGVNKVNRGTRTVVQCFAPRQNRASAVLEFESRAFDINDVIYCPYDNNLIAAGATDGKIYVWDQRYAKKGSAPLQVLAHGDSLNVLDHDRDREVADTGIRFLSWGATSSRLYSGSSDGVVKLWNPYRSSSEAHIKDTATFTSAIMSGAFSPDCRELLIGEDQGRINMLSVGHGKKSERSMDRFELDLAPSATCGAATGHSDGRKIARELLKSGQIELKPMGALPLRQAVQGRNYEGPYLAPSSTELQDAEREYQLALNLQNDAHSDAAMDSTQSSDLGQSLRETDKRVEAAQETVLRLQTRQDDSATLAPKAEAMQRAFRRAEKNLIKLEASLSRALEHCKLDCNYLPANVDEDGEVTDSRRSEGRIPTALWKAREVNTSEMDVDELICAGLTERCMTCLKPARKPEKGLPKCDSCTRKQEGVTATCEICSSPTRPSLDTTAPSLCERCNFACFRCGKPADTSSDFAKISCYACDLSWTAGVLGYELVK